MMKSIVLREKIEVQLFCNIEYIKWTKKKAMNSCQKRRDAIWKVRQVESGNKIIKICLSPVVYAYKLLWHVFFFLNIFLKKIIVPSSLPSISWFAFLAMSSVLLGLLIGENRLEKIKNYYAKTNVCYTKKNLARYKWFENTYLNIMERVRIAFASRSIQVQLIKHWNWLRWTEANNHYRTLGNRKNTNKKTIEYI